jgi:hypothetical protein
MTEPFDHRREPKVVGAEVVPPGRDAMRLVDHEQRRHVQLCEGVNDLLVGQLLGRKEEVLRVALTNRLPGVLTLAVALRGIHRDRLRRPTVLDSLKLVLLQRYQWRHH